jgi:O-acetyl-ADP-ribose deacetylase (regulator of RNase III)/uncharacterized protein YwgA
MIEFIKGNILDSDAEALVNTVNTVGVMGKGIALRFKKEFPANYKAYKNAVNKNEVDVGKMFVTKDYSCNGDEKIIINFPTKKDWRKPSEYSYVEKGLEDLLQKIKDYNIKSIAIPPLGAGNGGLEWELVKKIIHNKLKDLDIRIVIYEPTIAIKEALKKERVKLTEARALLLYILYDLIKQGEYVSEFSSEKVCYFLQRFGAKKFFNLKFDPNFYGPYSGKVKFILNVLNGSYITGYSDMNKKPFEPLMLVADGYETVFNFVSNKPELKEIGNKTINFLNGFYSDFALELLSSIDYIMNTQNIHETDKIKDQLEKWSDRKRSLFSNDKYFEITIEHLLEMQKKIDN